MDPFLKLDFVDHLKQLVPTHTDSFINTVVFMVWMPT